MSKPFWDFNEDTNYVIKNVGSEKYKVLDFSDSYEAATLLYQIKNYILDLMSSISTVPSNCIDGITILLSTPFQVQEMQLDTGFSGLNKPKGIVKTRRNKVGPDGNLRAKSRVIFITLRGNNGKLKTLNQLKPLILHEITHTACNHVTYRDAGNHAKDFDKYHKFIKRFK